MGKFDFFEEILRAKEDKIIEFLNTRFVKIGYYFSPLIVGQRANIDLYQIDGEIVKREPRNTSYVEDVYVVSPNDKKKKEWEKNEISIAKVSTGELYFGIKYMPDLLSYDMEIGFSDEKPVYGRKINVKTLSVSSGHGYMVTGVKKEERQIEVDKVVELNKELYAVKDQSDEMFIIEIR